jgi:hypothetical protein
LHQQAENESERKRLQIAMFMVKDEIQRLFNQVGQEPES